MSLKENMDIIVKQSIQAVLPDAAVKRALDELILPKGRVIVVALGKAAWQMAKTTYEVLENSISAGVIITKYGHAKGDIPSFKIFEAGHPIPDQNSFLATSYAADIVRNLEINDLVIMLISGGGSSLFEIPLCSEVSLQDITRQLLACGAEITEINTIRKRLSAVKGGRFAQLCYPAQIYSIVLSDILGDPLDMIASGPTYPDHSTNEMAKEIIKKYRLKINDDIVPLLEKETPKYCENVITNITGSVKELCTATATACQQLGYKPIILTTSLNCVAREAGSFLASLAREYQSSKESLAFIAGGETVVHLNGTGMGGRNQEIALAAADGISGLENTAVFSIGSDGTDGPTDAAGGFVDQDTRQILEAEGIKISDVLQQNDAYHALQESGGLIFTGATGTNVNDVSCVLIRR